MQPLPSARADLRAELAEFRPRIRRYVLGLVRDSDEAEDLTQDTFARAYRQLGSLRDPAAALPWLYSIATRVCLDRLRQRARRATRESDLRAEDAPVAGGASADAPVERDEMSACVRGYMGELSDSYRAVLLLHDVHGLTNPEIAELLGDTTGNVKIRLHRARKRLRDRLASECSFSYDASGVLVCQPGA